MNLEMWIETLAPLAAAVFAAMATWAVLVALGLSPVLLEAFVLAVAVYVFIVTMGYVDAGWPPKL
jgi:multisubunit Na+/H+ antiporter MnhC subunit